MKARDVMVSPVVTAKPSSLVSDVAKIFLEHRISAVPVVDDKGKLVGVVSEGDLIHRAEAGTEQQRSWWLRFLTSSETEAAEYTKAHARKIADVMTRSVITASPDTPLNEIAMLLERHSIKRVPVVSDGQLVGIVSRANLIQAVASVPEGLQITPSDETIRDKLLKHLSSQSWAHTRQLNVTVNRGVVNIWGITYSKEEQNAIRVAAENTPGARVVNIRLYIPAPPGPPF